MAESTTSAAPLLALEDVSRRFLVRRGWFGEPQQLTAVDGVSLGLRRGESLGLVGESGCGKSTLGRLACGLLMPSEGRVLLEGRARVTKGELVVSTLERGDLFGAAALYNRRTRYETTITALEDCAAAFFPQELVSRLMAESPAACANYIRYLSERIHFLSRKVEGLTAPSVTGKLARWLLETGRTEGRCPATELSHRLDVSRASLYRAFEVLEGAGAIRRTGKLVQTADREALLRQSQA